MPETNERKTPHTGPGKSHRKGITLAQLTRMFPNEEAAASWFEATIWSCGRFCGKCGSVNTHRVKSGKPMPYRCRDCRGYFSIRTGTVMSHSHISLQNWAFAIYLEVTNLKGVSSMKLHRDLGIGQKAAWFMLHRIRETWDHNIAPFVGPVEVDEAYFGGLEKNKHAKKKLNAGRGPVGKTPVVGVKDRASNRVAAHVVDRVDGETLTGIVLAHTEEGSTVYTDEHGGYEQLGGRYEHETVKHSVGEYVRGMASTNGVESFWAMLKRGYHGVYHQMSPKHLQRYVNEFAGRHGLREMDTTDQMSAVVAGFMGKRLTYRDLTG